MVDARGSPAGFRKFYGPKPADLEGQRLGRGRFNSYTYYHFLPPEWLLDFISSQICVDGAKDNKEITEFAKYVFEPEVWQT